MSTMKKTLALVPASLRAAVVALAVVTLGVSLLLAPGCNPSPPAPSPAPASDTHGPVKLPVNNAAAVGRLVAELPVVEWQKTSADLSTTQDAGTTETCIGQIGPGPDSIPIGGIQFTPNAALTASDTQNAVLLVYKRNAPDGGGGTTQTLLGTASTFTPGLDGGTGNWSPFTPVNFTLVAGAYLSPADNITLVINKNGTTGVSVPQGSISIYTTFQ